MVKTTLNLHVEVLNRIGECADRLNRSRKEIIVMLLKRIMRDMDRYARSFRTVEYQEDAPKDMWRCYHVRFREDENEFFVDLRKFCKRSVSLLVAIALRDYCDELLGNAVTSCNFCHYVFFHEKVEGIYSWRLYWGFPVHELNRLRL